MIKFFYAQSHLFFASEIEIQNFNYMKHPWRDPCQDMQNSIVALNKIKNIDPKCRLLLKAGWWRYQNRTIWFENLLFEVISKSFCIIFGQKIEEHVKTIKQHCLEAKNDDFHKNGFKKGVFSWRVSLESFLASFLAKSAADHTIYLIHLIKSINFIEYFD